MDRAKDRSPRRDAPALEVRQNRIERRVDRDHEAVVDVTLARVGRHSAARRARERGAIARGERAAPRDEGVEPRQLAAAERRLHVGHLVVEARRQLGSLVVVARVAGARDEIGGPHDRAPLTGGEELGRVERAHRERRPARRPGRPPSVAPSVWAQSSTSGTPRRWKSARSTASPNGCTTMTARVRAVRRRAASSADSPSVSGIGVGQHRRRAAARHRVVDRVADVGRHDDLVARARRRGRGARARGRRCPS